MLVELVSAFRECLGWRPCECLTRLVEDMSMITDDVKVLVEEVSALLVLLVAVRLLWSL